MRYALILGNMAILIVISFVSGFAFCQWGYAEKERQQKENQWN